MQFYGLSIGRVDLVFGTALAVACCAPTLEVQTTADAVGGGYSNELQGRPLSDIPGQLQSRVDVSVVSSSLPIGDPGQMLTFTAPPLSRSIGQ
jgi:hypothetical protein